MTEYEIDTATLGRQVIEQLERANRYARDIVTLQRRGLSRKLLQELASGGPSPNQGVMVGELLAQTAPPPHRSWLSRTWLRVRVAFGAPDPDAARRAEVAEWIRKLNEAEPQDRSC